MISDSSHFLNHSDEFCTHVKGFVGKDGAQTNLPVVSAGSMAPQLCETMPAGLLESSGEGLLPVVGSIRAGFDGACEEELLGFRPAFDGCAENHFYFVIKNGDLSPDICENDLALVKIQSDVESGDLALILIDDKPGVIKRVVKQCSGLLLEPLNPSGCAQYFPKEALHRLQIRGKIIEISKRW